MSKMQSPEERPDLYDDFDFPDRPEGYQTGIDTPPENQRMIDQRKAGREKSSQVSDDRSREDS